LNIGDSNSFEMDSGNLTLSLSPGATPFPGVFDVVGIFIALVSFVAVICVLLVRKRRRVLRLRPDYDEFR
jgi:hypothetical protein